MKIFLLHSLIKPGLKEFQSYQKKNIYRNFFWCFLTFWWLDFFDILDTALRLQWQHSSTEVLASSSMISSVCAWSVLFSECEKGSGRESKYFRGGSFHSVKWKDVIRTQIWNWKKKKKRGKGAQKKRNFSFFFCIFFRSLVSLLEEDTVKGQMFGGAAGKEQIQRPTELVEASRRIAQLCGSCAFR